MICPNCGAENEAGAAFCHECGAAMPKRAPDQVKQGAKKVAQEDYQDPAYLDVRHPIVRFFSLLMALILFFSLSAAALFYLTRSLTKDEYVEQIFHALDLSTMRVGYASKGDDEPQTLPQVLAKAFTSPVSSVVTVNEEGMKALLRDPSAKTFFVRKTKDYLSDLYKGTGEGKISPSEVMSLVKSNPEAAAQMFGTMPNESEYSNIESLLSVSGALEAVSLRSLIGADKLKIAQFCFSNFGIGCMIFGSMLIVGLIYLINRFNRAAFLKYLGSPLIAIGIAGLILSIAAVPLSAYISMKAKYDFYDAVVSTLAGKAIIFFAETLALGAVLTLIYVIIHKIMMSAEKRRRRREEKRMQAA